MRIPTTTRARPIRRRRIFTITAVAAAVASAVVAAATGVGGG